MLELIQQQEEAKKAKEKIIAELYRTGLCGVVATSKNINQADKADKLFKLLCERLVETVKKCHERGIYPEEISLEEIREIADKLATYSREDAMIFLNIENVSLTLSEEEKPEIARVEEFPIHTLPRFFQTLITQAASAFNAPADFFAVSLLSIAGTAIGNRRVLRIKSTWHAKPLVWAAIVAEPGSAKSPAIGFMMKPIEKLQRRLYEEYKYQTKLYQENEEEEKPILEHVFTTDSTKEKLSEMILHSPNGFMIYQDELTGWVRSMNQYKNGRGSDKQFALSLWNGSGIKIDRKMEETIFAEESFVSVLGGIQPDMLGELVEDGKDDGFVNRILFSFPEPIPRKYTEDEIEEHLVKEYHEKVVALNQLNGRKELIWANQEAHENWLEVMKMHDFEVNSPEFPQNLRGAWAKLPEYTARIALIIQMLRYITGESKTENVEAMSVIYAKAIIDYFKSHLKKTYGKFTESPIEKKIDRLIQWMKENKKHQVKRREVQKSSVAGVKYSRDVDEIFYAAMDRGYGKVIKKGRSVIFVLEV
jgi:Protein of unknown function (DUF3987)